MAVNDGNTNRRGFLKSLASLSAMIGSEIVFARNLPTGVWPLAAFSDEGVSVMPGKDPGLILLNDRPVNAETPAHLLNDRITPASRLFVRNNGLPPVNPNPETRTLTVEGESAESTKTFSIKQLRRKFENVALQLTMECGGNGRSEFIPKARGNQWTLGAVGCPRWHGVRLREVLRSVGVKNDAVYVAFYGADTHLSGQAGKIPISRGVPIEKALQAESMIAWGINGEDLPLLNGYPLRLVFGGWPGSTSGKWLTRIVIRNQVHDGPKMIGSSYRVPCAPVAPGAKVAPEDMCIIHGMPVKSLITRPETGLKVKVDQRLEVGGHAWAGENSVAEMMVSIDFGQTWQPARLEKPVNRFAWQHWQAHVTFPKKGYYEIWARATDDKGVSQPMVLPGWNPKGYLNNACHRIAVRVQA